MTHEDEKLVIWQRQRWYCCFSWRKPLMAGSWKDDGGHTVPRHHHPRNKELAKALSGQSSQRWDWQIVIRENTDSDGWQYASCFWLRLGKLRVNGRSKERALDFVKQRSWVHRSHADEFLSACTKGSVNLVDPVEMAALKRETKAKLDEGWAQIWDLLAKLDNAANFKSMANALLDPMAMRAVAYEHYKVMKQLQSKSLDQLPTAHIDKSEAKPPNKKLRWVQALKASKMIRANQQQQQHSPFAAADIQHAPDAAGTSPASPTRPAPNNARPVFDIEATTSRGPPTSAASRLGAPLRSMSLPSAVRAAGGSRAAGADRQEPAGLPKLGLVIKQLLGNPGKPSARQDMQNAMAATFLPYLGLGKKPTASKQPDRMIITQTELECACGHALSIYGQLEHKLGTDQVKTQYDAVARYTGVPESDILMAVWRSQPFEPAHYVAIDRARRKIVVCVRGTTESVDTITDLVGAPLVYDFGGPGMLGVTHKGIMQAAQATYKSCREDVLQAVKDHPSFSLFITGHSLGGGAAALIALLMHQDTALPQATRDGLRAVCLAPAAVMSKNLSLMTQHFIASVIYRYDMVPRISISTVAKFLQQVSQASPLKRAWLAIARALNYSTSTPAAPAAATATTTDSTPPLPAADVVPGKELEVAAPEDIPVQVDASGASGADTVPPLASEQQDAASAEIMPDSKPDVLSSASGRRADSMLDHQESALDGALAELQLALQDEGHQQAGDAGGQVPTFISHKAAEAMAYLKKAREHVHAMRAARKSSGAAGLEPPEASGSSGAASGPNEAAAVHSSPTTHAGWNQMQNDMADDLHSAMSELQLGLLGQKELQLTPAHSHATDIAFNNSSPVPPHTSVHEQAAAAAVAATDEEQDAVSFMTLPPAAGPRPSSRVLYSSFSMGPTLDRRPVVQEGPMLAPVEPQQQAAVDVSKTAGADAQAKVQPAVLSDTEAKLLLQPLQPPGSLYWLVPDTRPRILRSGEGWQRLDEFRKDLIMKLPSAAGASRDVQPQADGQDLPGGESTTFMAGMTHDLGPDEEGQEKPGAVDRSKLVLLEATNEQFSELLFFRKAVMDHMPLAYYKAIQQFLKSANKQ